MLKVVHDADSSKQDGGERSPWRNSSSAALTTAQRCRSRENARRGAQSAMSGYQVAGRLRLVAPHRKAVLRNTPSRGDQLGLRSRMCSLPGM